MKFQTKYFVSAFFALTLLLGWVTPVYAAPTVISVSPSSIINDVPRTITIKGTEFGSTTSVLMDGTAFTTQLVVDAETLTAIVPALTAPGPHVITITVAGVPISPSLNLDVTDSVVPPTPTFTAVPTSTVTPAFARPQLVISSYKANVSAIQTGKEFKVHIGFDNAGSSGAINVQAVFTSADLVPTKNGGVVALGAIGAGGNDTTSQTFLAVESVYGKSFVIVDVALSYYDSAGMAYSDKFTLNIPAGGGTSGVVYPTSTPTGVQSGQLIIPSYGTTIDPLQPGSQFTLTMTVQNVGNDMAQRVTMIVGGGSSGSGGSTPQPGGVSGGSGEFTNFAPLGTSNVQSLGDLKAGGKVQVSQSLIVNVSTNPGAYPMKVTFSYLNDKGETVNDEQVITLLVFSLPNVEINFYRPPDPFFVGQPGALPIQVVNLGKRTAVLGNMTITTENGMLENSEALIGALDAGFNFTIDSTFIPDTVGTYPLKIVIEYTDDFNQERTIEKTLEVEVLEGFDETPLDPSMEEGGGQETFAPVSEENFLQKTWRFILGLLGLDSAPPPTSPDFQVPPENIPVEPVPNGGGGKG